MAANERRSSSASSPRRIASERSRATSDATPRWLCSWATATLPAARMKKATSDSSSVTPRCRDRADAKGPAISEVLPAAVDADEAAPCGREPLEHGSVAHDVGARVAAHVAGDDDGAADHRASRRGVVPGERCRMDDALDRDVAREAEFA